VIGRLASLKTTLQLGTVTNTLLYTATEMVTVNISASNQTEEELTHSVSISGDSGAQELTVTDGGSGYSLGSNLLLLGGSGTGASVNITEVSNGAVTEVEIVADGSGYSTGDVLTIPNANATGAKTLGPFISNGTGYTQGIYADVGTTSVSGSSSPESYTVYVTGAQQGGYGGDFYTFGNGGTDRLGSVSGNAPTINLTVGDTLNVDLNDIAPAHPFAIRTSLGGTAAGGVTGEGTANVTWDTTGLPAGTYYYQCMSHPSMNGQIVLSAAGGSGSGLTVDIEVDNNETVVSAVINNDGLNYTDGDIVTIDGGDAADLARLNVSVTHGNSAKLSGVYAGNLDSDYIAYGIPMKVGGNDMYDDVTLKPGDAVYVSSSEPGVSFTVIANKAYGNVNADVQKNLGRRNSYISSTAFPQINDNVGLFTSKYDGVATIHVSNRNSDQTAAVSVGIAEGDTSTFGVADFFVFGQRLQPLQDLTIDNIGIASGQTLITRASRTDVAFAAYTRPIELQFAGVGTDGSVNTTGVITATAFAGDGSAITGVIAAGSGVSITSNGSQVGVAATIDFGSEFNITTVSAGVATITAGTIPSATTADFASVAGVATVATTANSLAVGVAVTRADTAGVADQCTGNSATASVASGITSDFDIFTNNPIRTTDKFFGDGSQLTGIVATGNGIGIQNGGSFVGTGITVNFAQSIDVTPVSSGITTVSVQKVPHADICGVATFANLAGVATFADNAGIASNALNANFAQAASFSTLTGAAETSKSLYTEHKGNFLPLPVTLGTKTTDHRYIGVGSDRSINIQGFESPYLRFEVGQTYRFENAAQQGNYPLEFYYAASGDPVGFGTTSPAKMTQGVTVTGSYTEISVTEETPQLFYYGVGVGTTMGSMGNSIQVFNSDFHKVLRVGEYKNKAGLKTCTHTQMFEGRATASYMNTNLGVGNSDYVPGDRSHNVSSIEQQSTGVYQVNFADAMNDNNYAVVINGRGTNNFPGGLVDATVYDRTITGFGVTIYNGIPAPEDLRDVNIVVYGGQDGEPTFL